MTDKEEVAQEIKAALNILTHESLPIVVMDAEKHLETALETLDGKREAMTEDEILARVEKREFEKRCVDANICPTCGGNLSMDEGTPVCASCSLSFPYYA